MKLCSATWSILLRCKTEKWEKLVLSNTIPNLVSVEEMEAPSHTQKGKYPALSTKCSVWGSRSCLWAKICLNKDEKLEKHKKFQINKISCKNNSSKCHLTPSLQKKYNVLEGEKGKFAKLRCKLGDFIRTSDQSIGEQNSATDIFIRGKQSNNKIWVNLRCRISVLEKEFKDMK